MAVATYTLTVESHIDHLFPHVFLVEGRDFERLGSGSSDVRGALRENRCVWLWVESQARLV
jgi:hypothetical protein